MSKIDKIGYLYPYCLFTSFFLFAVVVYRLSSAGTTPYDYFVRLADAFLAGRYWLSESVPWLSELIPGGTGRFYVVFPPMPAILLVPFVFFYGHNFPQQYLAHILGAGMAVSAMVIAWKSRDFYKDRLHANSSYSPPFNDYRYIPLVLWSGLLVGFGTISWYMSATGSAWYLGQITAAFFLTLAIAIGLNGNRPLLVGVFLGAAYLSRIHTILSVFFFIYLVNVGHFNSSNIRFCVYRILKFIWTRETLLLLLGVVPFLGFNVWYNFVRFGIPFDVGYALIPGVLEEPWYKYGLVSPMYITQNLKVAFWSFPKILETFPYIMPSWGGLAMWITTPAFVYAFWADLKNTLVKLSWLSVLLICILVLMHGGSGWTQFGYRYGADFYAFLIFLTIKGVSRIGLKWHHWLLLLLSIGVNLWGVVWINYFGWVDF